MTTRHIQFDKFQFPVMKGLEYLVNESVPETDFLLINEPDESFSMTFEKGFPVFTVPERSDRDHLTFELKRQGRIIRFFCPERRENLDTAVWYFCLDILDETGETHSLPGQVRVEFSGDCLRGPRGKPRFIEVLESIELKKTNN